MLYLDFVPFPSRIASMLYKSKNSLQFTHIDVDLDVDICCFRIFFGYNVHLKSSFLSDVSCVV